MITLKQLQPQIWAIRSDGRKVGEIIQSRAGFRYVPKGGRHAGEFFPDFAACFDSLKVA